MASVKLMTMLRLTRKQLFGARIKDVLSYIIRKSDSIKQTV